MGEGTELVTVYVTAPNLIVARKIALAALDAKLAACANLFPVESLYDWEGARQQENEIAMLLKTTREAAPRLMDLVKREHPYEVPCIEVIGVEAAAEAYASWVGSSVRG